MDLTVKYTHAYQKFVFLTLNWFDTIGIHLLHPLISRLGSLLRLKMVTVAQYYLKEYKLPEINNMFLWENSYKYILKN